MIARLKFPYAKTSCLNSGRFYIQDAFTKDIEVDW